MKKHLLFTFISLTFFVNAQIPNPIVITGTILDEDTNQPLEYATFVLQSLRNPDKVTGGITDATGKFSIETLPGKYNVRIEYITYKTYELKEQSYKASTDLGIIKLTLDVEQLAAVEVVGERTTVELRLDKKVYNVGSDLTVKGGTVTDVLDNVPSVSVDEEGNISLRGNESVRILINGKPSALSGLSPEVLQQLPANTIEKVEVITNPSARYDAEGTAGILNIILKQSKTAGLNGSANVFVGEPKTYGGAVSLNLRRNTFNIFANTTYRYKNSLGNALFEQENFNTDGSTASFQDEKRKYKRQSDGFNTNIGFEFYIDATSSITNSFVYGKSDGDNMVDVNFSNFDAQSNPTIQRNRFTNEAEERENVQYSVNYQKKFNDDGHELKIDYQYSTGEEFENSIINEIILGELIELDTEQIINDETQINQLVQFDYVLPFGKNDKSQFEMGYRGTFNNFNTNFIFGILENEQLNSDLNVSNELNYKEYVNAGYMQIGSKFKKFNLLGGLRVESSDIGIELITTNEISDKDYVNWFPSLFLGYEFSETEQLTMSYSRRLRRPRSRFINPFPSRSSNTNLFQGNPDIDPTYTGAYDLSYLKRWEKISFSTSAYFNQSKGVFLFITQETGDFVTIENPNNPTNPVIIPVQVRTPINLATDNRYGWEFTTTYTPKRSWRLTWNLNLFQQQLRGRNTFINFQNETITQNFDADNFTWFTRLSAKLPIPGKIDFQTNLFYRGPNKNGQNKNKGILSTNLAFSKDVIKNKATLSLNVKDLFNSRKRRRETKTENVFTYSEFQWRQRQINLSFLYRFNQKKYPKNGNRQRGNGGGDGDFDIEG